jgi:hypothetical protein
LGNTAGTAAAVASGIGGKRGGSKVMAHPRAST